MLCKFHLSSYFNCISVQKKNDAVHPYNYNVPLNSPSHLVLFPVAETKWSLLSPEYGNGVQNFLD